MPVTNLSELNALAARVKQAQQTFAGFTQEQVDLIFRHAALAAADARIPLAQMAVEETGMGVVEDKVVKNHFASEYIYNAYKDEKTCGDARDRRGARDPHHGRAGGPHLRHRAHHQSDLDRHLQGAHQPQDPQRHHLQPASAGEGRTCAAARLVLEAAVAAGAPADIIGWIDEPSLELSTALMHHPAINLILATGGPGMVHAAYSSGKPAIGVGAGNTPVVIDETADIKRAVASILMSKTFDNGVVCASEQSVIAVDAVYDAVRERFATHGGYMLQPDEVRRCAGWY